MSEQKELKKRSLANVKLYDQTFSSAKGKKILWDLMKHAGFLESANNINPQELAFKEGQMDMVRYIMGKMKVNYQQLEKLIDGGLNDDRSIWE